MINKIGYWENALAQEITQYQLFLNNQKQKRDKLLNTDILNLPESEQQKHLSKIEYIEGVIEMFTAIMKMLLDIKECYWLSLDELVNENYDLRRQIIVLTAANKFIIRTIGKIKMSIYKPASNQREKHENKSK